MRQVNKQHPSNLKSGKVMSGIEKNVVQHGKQTINPDGTTTITYIAKKTAYKGEPINATMTFSPKGQIISSTAPLSQFTTI